jgi:predicted membrane-bound dolichyl-phosphate-mannose-protein mannosyltransferase
LPKCKKIIIRVVTPTKAFLEFLKTFIKKIGVLDWVQNNLKIFEAH